MEIQNNVPYIPPEPSIEQTSTVPPSAPVETTTPPAPLPPDQGQIIDLFA